MKKLIVLFVILFASGFVSEKEARHSNVNFGYFYHTLQPYGEWIEIDYDVYVWKPYRVARSWSPYSVGHWEYTSYGWYWESYEPFGWATYHYGRWYNDDYYGWVWVPGYEWGPSWVEWRYSDAYIGWSPLPPFAEFRLNVGIHFSISYRTSYHHWNFVTYNYFCRPYVHNHFVDYRYKNRIFNNTKYRTNYYANGGRVINGGIDRNYVERRSGVNIRERDIARATDLREYAGSRNSRDRIVSYRPDEREVQKYRDVEKRNISDGRGKAKLNRDMVTFRERESEPSRSNARENVERDDRYRSSDVTRNNNKVYEGVRPHPNVNKTEPNDRLPKAEKRSEPKTRSYRAPESSRRENTYKSPPAKRENKSVRENKSNSSSTKSYRQSSSSSTKQNRSVSPSRNNSRNNSTINRSNSSQREKSKSTRSNNSSRGKKRDR